MRVWERIKKYRKPDEDDLSVTVMLMVATAGFSTPWEFLKQNNSGKTVGVGHPAFKDVPKKRYDSLLKRLNVNFSKKLVASDLFSTNGNFIWDVRHVKELKQVRDAGEYRVGDMLSPTDIDARFLLKILRNALAHNNICAFGRSDQIERISFFAEDAKMLDDRKEVVGWYVATTTVHGFEDFLNKWFKMIKEPQLTLVLPDALKIDDQRVAA